MADLELLADELGKKGTQIRMRKPVFVRTLS